MNQPQGASAKNPNSVPRPFASDFCIHSNMKGVSTFLRQKCWQTQRDGLAVFGTSPRLEHRQIARETGG